MIRLGKKRIRWLLVGMALSLLGPTSEWVLLRGFVEQGLVPVHLTYLYTEISALLVFSLFGYLLGSYADRLETLALTDNLTGLYNRHFLMERLSEVHRLQQRYDQTYSLILLDLDHFKQVNDRYGHLTGDQTLKAVARTLTKELRRTDLASRFGGEEFLVLCPHTSAAEAVPLAERIAQAVKDLKQDQIGHPGPQRLSAGVYEVSGPETPSLAQVLDRTDQALYQAKAEGRDCVRTGNNTPRPSR